MWRMYCGDLFGEIEKKVFKKVFSTRKIVSSSQLYNKNSS